MKKADQHIVQELKIKIDGSIILIDDNRIHCDKMHAEFGEWKNKDYDHCLYRVFELEILLKLLNE